VKNVAKVAQQAKNRILAEVVDFVERSGPNIRNREGPQGVEEIIEHYFPRW